MKTTTIAIVSVLAGLAVAGVVLVEGRSRPDAGQAAILGARFAPELHQRINDVALIQVNRAGEPLTIRRDGDRWLVVEKGDYPATPEKVRGTLVGLAELRTAEAMTARKENYEKLGVQDAPASPGQSESNPGTPTVVTMKDGQGQTISSVIIGSTKWGARPGVYVRRSGETQSWLAHGQLDIPVGITGWAESKILDLMRDRVKQVSIHHADGEVVLITRADPAQSSFTVHNVAEGKELKSPAAGDALGSSMAYVNFEDVAAAEAIDFSRPAATVEFRTFDGVVITLDTLERDGATWAKFAAANDAAAERPADPGAAQLLSPEEAQRQAAELDAKFSRWAFQIPQWKAVTLRTRMVDLYKDTPPAMPASMQGVEIMDPGQLMAPPPPQEPGGPQG
jgi:hypothetical protein